MVVAWHGHGLTSVNQTRLHCVNQMGKTHSKPLAARHGSGTAWARHGKGMLCVNRPLISVVSRGGTNKFHAIFGVSTVVIILTMDTRFPRKPVDSTTLIIISKMKEAGYKIHVRR